MGVKSLFYCSCVWRCRQRINKNEKCANDVHSEIAQGRNKNKIESTWITWKTSNLPSPIISCYMWMRIPQLFHTAVNIMNQTKWLNTRDKIHVNFHPQSRFHKRQGYEKIEDYDSSEIIKSHLFLDKLMMN